jgi:hypothetical protein
MSAQTESKRAQERLIVLLLPPLCGSLANATTQGRSGGVHFCAARLATEQKMSKSKIVLALAAYVALIGLASIFVRAIG